MSVTAFINPKVLIKLSYNIINKNIALKVLNYVIVIFVYITPFVLEALCDNIITLIGTLVKKEISSD